MNQTFADLLVRIPSMSAQELDELEKLLDELSAVFTARKHALKQAQPPEYITEPESRTLLAKLTEIGLPWRWLAKHWKLSEPKMRFVTRGQFADAMERPQTLLAEWRKETPVLAESKFPAPAPQKEGVPV